MTPSSESLISPISPQAQQNSSWENGLLSGQPSSAMVLNDLGLGSTRIVNVSHRSDPVPLDRDRRRVDLRGADLDQIPPNDEYIRGLLAHRDVYQFKSRHLRLPYSDCIGTRPSRFHLNRRNLARPNVDQSFRTDLELADDDR